MAVPLNPLIGIPPTTPDVTGRNTMFLQRLRAMRAVDDMIGDISKHRAHYGVE